MKFSPPLNRRFATLLSPSHLSVIVRKFRSDAALEALHKASEDKVPNLVLYNYPSFSGAYGALFAHLYYSRLNLPCLILPFSSVVPFSVEDVCIDGMKTCYFLDFSGPKGFASKLSKRCSAKVIGFDHRKSVHSTIAMGEDSHTNINFHVNLEKSSSTAVYEHFSDKLSEAGHINDNSMSLLNPEDRERVETILKYLEDGDLRNWSLPDIRAFNFGLKEWRSKLNSVTTLNMYHQLTQICSMDLIAKGNRYFSCRQTEAKKLLHKVFKLNLGQGFYGECLGVRADGNANFSDELAKELSRRSAEAGLRPIGAVIYMQRNNLKMCLRTLDSNTDTSEIAKAYGGGGTPKSSSFIIRMDEFNHWLRYNHAHKTKVVVLYHSPWS